jgi:beta-aspartyl-peptidase (threonine type)
VKNIRNALGTIVVLVLSIIQVAEAKPKEKFALVIHGGAGTILKKNMTPKKEAAYRAKLEESLKAGYKILSSGGSALDAVEATIHVMEDSPLFNAGKGAVFTNAGTNELDAAIMNGADLKAGAVAGGVICIDAKGNIAMPFNTKGMYRGYIKSDGKAVTLIYKND